MSSQTGEDTDAVRHTAEEVAANCPLYTDRGGFTV